MSHQITCASALSGKTGKRKIAFSLKCLLVHCLNSTSCLISSIFFDSRLTLTLLCDSLSLVINAYSYRDCWRHGSGERKSIALKQLDCVVSTIHQCAVFWVSYFAR